MENCTFVTVGRFKATTDFILRTATNAFVIRGFYIHESQRESDPWSPRLKAALHTWTGIWFIFRSMGPKLIFLLPHVIWR